MKLNTQRSKRFNDELRGCHRAVSVFAVRLVRRRRWGKDTGLPEGHEAEDLLQEACIVVLDGTRKWPKKVTLEVLLKQIMRSLVSHLLAGPANREISIDGPGRLDLVERRATGRAVADPSELLRREERAARIAALARAQTRGNLEEEAVLTGVFDGATLPREIAEDTGLPVEKVQTVIKRLRRRLREVVTTWSDE